MISRAVAEAVLRDVIAACDPATRVREALGDPAVAARLAGRRRIGIAIGKAALAMARGAGEVAEGVAVVPRGAGEVAERGAVVSRGADAGSGEVDVASRVADEELPPGWRLLEGSHPVPDEGSVAAGAAVLDLVRCARDTDVVLALLSGGASALAEQPVVPLDELVATIRAVMAAGAPIDEINAVRSALSAIKAGQLALASAAPVITLAVSDVIGDPLAVIGSGPTIGPWLASPGGAVDDGSADRRARARAVLARLGLPAPPVLAADLPARTVVRSDHAAVIAPMASAGRAALGALAARGIAATLIEAPIAGDVEDVAGMLARAPAGGEAAGAIVEAAIAGDVEDVAGMLARTPGGGGAAGAIVEAAIAGEVENVAGKLASAPARGGVAGVIVEAVSAGEVEDVARRAGSASEVEDVARRAGSAQGVALVAWGEPTLRLPAQHGVGGRAQQLALVLARWLRGTERSALVVGTDGVDGPPPPDRPAPAGAWVDGTTWDAIAAAGCDPAAALAACDAGTALAAVGALVVIGPSGINHADLVILG
jgi:glycerate 2-kinase